MVNDARKYWALEFLEENDLTSIKQAAAFLPSYGALKTLRRRAEEAASRQKNVPGEMGLSILAGSGVDLSGGGLACPSPSCIRAQVDVLFKHVWHYFDNVVVNDVLTPLLTEDWHGSNKSLFEAILRQFSPLIYLNEIGGAEFVRFVPKSLCYKHRETHAQEQGLGRVIDAKDGLIASMMRDASFSFLTEDETKFVLMHLGEVAVEAKVGNRSAQIAKMDLASEVFNDHLVELTSDVAAAHQYDLPLGLVQSISGQMLQMSRPTSVADVVFQLELPVLDGISTIDLIRIRREQSEYFSSFRNALTRAARDRLNLHPADSSDVAAEQIRTDVIEPELEKIRQRLASAERSLAKKTSIGLLLGALTTTCGLLFGAPTPLAGSAGVAAVVGITGTAASKHIDEVREVSLNDMYFLWKAIGHSH